MNIPASFLIVSNSPLLSLLLWFVLISALFYMARKPAHDAIISASRILFHAFRLGGASLVLAAKRLKVRNKEVLLAEGKVASERIIEREFERVNAAVTKDLSTFPALQRSISETVTEIDEDYHKSAEVPPAPPGWAKALEPIATISTADNSMVAEVLKSIKVALDKGQEKSLAEYRTSSKERHAWLKKMVPNLRQIEKGLSEANLCIKNLLERSSTIDRHMDEFEQINKGSNMVEQKLSSSSLTQFFISGFVLAIAIGGAIINFNLIARPMQEMVGGSVHMLGFRVADIAALVIILVEVSMGLFLMESLRITRLFPVIGALEDKVRFRMVIVSFVFLFLLASIESGLAYMRELLSQDDAALVAGLLGDVANNPVEMSGRWITMAAQMGMGFVLPFALTFVAIPLESFIHSLRTVLGVVFVGFLYLSAGLLRLLGNISRYSGKSLVNIYDLVIFLPLWVERTIVARNSIGVETGVAAENMTAFDSNSSKEQNYSKASTKKRMSRKVITKKTVKKGDDSSLTQTQEVLS